MNVVLSFVVHTANILGIFADPFEFEGDYGPEVNPIRQQVFELVVSPEALAKNLSDFELSQRLKGANEQELQELRLFLINDAQQIEKEYGPTLGELINSKILSEIKQKQINNSDFAIILKFVEKYKDQKIFHFLRNNPPELLHLDKALRDQAARNGEIFNLPILGSTKALVGNDSFELKKNLMDAVFTKETLQLTKPQEKTNQIIRQLDSDYLKEFFGESAENKDLEAFSSPLGQLFFYWMYQSLNLELIPQELIPQVNKVKEIFARTLGDPIARANEFKDKLVAADTSVLFTQESDALVPKALTKDGLFLPIDRQNMQDGTLILLRSDLFEPDYQIIPIENYEGFDKGRINVILATRKDSSQQFLLASCHGNSTKPEDGRLQIKLIMDKFHELSDGNLQLLIGIDANTKTEEDVRMFKEHLESLGLISTQTGPTTIKKRMVTAQHSKSGRFAIDEEDYLITLTPEHGGNFDFSHVTVGFKEEQVDTSQPLPNIHNPSDHYPVGANLIKNLTATSPQI